MRRFNKKFQPHHLTTAAALALLSQPLVAELGCPTGFVPDGNEKIVDGSFTQGYASFTSDIPFKFPRGQYPVDGNPPNNSPYSSTAISIIDGDVDLSNEVKQIAFPGDSSPGAGLPVIPPSSSWFAYNGVDAGAPSKLWEQEISGLEPNSNYAFTAYVSNALAPGLQAVGAAAPRISFQLDGVQIGAPFPVCDAGGPLDPVQGDCANEATEDRWHRVGVTANPGAKTTIKVSIHDVQPNKTTYGNDLAMTRVSLQKCVPIGTPDIDVSVNGATTSTVLFAPFSPGGPAIDRTITVTNRGSGTLVIGNIANPANADFTIVSDNCSTKSLGPSESCTIEMQFIPGNEGSTVLAIPSNDPDENPLELTLKSQGRGQGQGAVLGGTENREILTRLEGGVGGFGLPFALALLPLALRRRRLIAAATLLGLGTAAQAEQGQFYIGGGFGMSTLEPKIVNLPLKVDENNDKVFKFVLGYDLLDWLSVEGFGARMGSASISNGRDIDYNSYGIGVVANLPNNVSGVSLLGRLGYGQIDNSGNIAFREVEDHEIYAGIGIEYQFDNDFSLRGEYDYIDKDATMITVNLVKRFGGNDDESTPPPIAPAPAPAPKVVAAPQPAPTPSLPEKKPVEVITLVLEPIHFATDSAALTAEARGRLDRIVNVMQTYPQVKLLIVGHTDSRASDDYNLILSLKRAKAAMDYLTTKGIDRKRLSYEGRGEREPIADNRTKEGRAKNRRAEFHPTPRKVEKKQ